MAAANRAAADDARTQHRASTTDVAPVAHAGALNKRQLAPQRAVTRRGHQATGAAHGLFRLSVPEAATAAGVQRACAR